MGSFKKGLKNITDGSIFSAVKYFLETYDRQDFKKLNRDHAWANKKMINLKGYPLLQNRPPDAVVAINNLSSRASDAMREKRYRYRGLGDGRYCVTNMKNGNQY